MFSPRLYKKTIITRLQSWGNSQGIRLPKALLATLQLAEGSRVEIELSPRKDAVIMKPATISSRVRGRHRIENLVAAMPKGYKSAEFDCGMSGREVW